MGAVIVDDDPVVAMLAEWIINYSEREARKELGI